MGLFSLELMLFEGRSRRQGGNIKVDRVILKKDNWVNQVYYPQKPLFVYKTTWVLIKQRLAQQ
jgi:hypothetical protein